MLAVMVSKWVGDAFGKEGIYEAWMKLRDHPWLAPIEHRDNGDNAASVMTSVDRLTTIEAFGCTVRYLGMLEEIVGLSIGFESFILDELVKKCHYYGFPVVHGDNLVGFITREKLRLSIGRYLILVMFSFASWYCHSAFRHGPW